MEKLKRLMLMKKLTFKPLETSSVTRSNSLFKVLPEHYLLQYKPQIG